jgi:hypothetical protein
MTAMTTLTKQVPAHLARSLDLHRGDRLSVVDEHADGGVVILHLTQVEPSPLSSASARTRDTRKAALERFASGVQISQPSSQEELEDSRFAYLRAKHLK